MPHNPPRKALVPVSHDRDLAVAAMVIAMAGSLGMLGLARGLVLPGTMPGLVPLNPVGGVMAALMLLCTPAAMGIWLGRARARPAAIAGALGGGAVWLFTGPLVLMPRLGAQVLDQLTTTLPVSTGMALVGDALTAGLGLLAPGLPAAMLVGAALTWTGAEFSARTASGPLRSDPVARMVAAGAGISLFMGLSAYALLGLPGLGPTFAPASWLLAARMLEAGPAASALMLGPPALLGAVAWRALRAREQATDDPTTLASPIAAGAWTFVALLGAGGLPVALCSSLATGLLPLLASNDGAAPVVDPAVWDAMYDHTMVGLVACMLTGLVVTTVAGAFVSPQVIEVDATAKAKTKALDWFR